MFTGMSEDTCPPLLDPLIITSPSLLLPLSPFTEVECGVRGSQSHPEPEGEEEAVG